MSVHPTFQDVRRFNASAAWSKLPANLQAEIGQAALRLGVAAAHHESNWPAQECNAAGLIESRALSDLCTSVEILWPAILQNGR